MKPVNEDVQHRILLSARAEFATFGLAGARIDRIASNAHASKERLYAYFSDKAALFRAVLDLNGCEFYDAVALRADAVADFVGDIFDHSLDRPEHLRMLTWARLDGVPFAPPTGSDAPAGKVETLRAAQRLGLVDTRWDPELLLTMLFSLGFAWANSPVPGAVANDPDVRSRQREAAVAAATRIIQPR
ncbi:TetR family transcriptional regulator [Glaciihabitans tibetensis]|uniref:TetR family transcriptional regulator n=1 Tax=Glaciihabitans tibetensis TaxID=1266600 RepID=A0A2T0VJY2_9MICO|nr:TetR family transcriptional regulator [Glaciihabitans tibetensis]PRY70499.1 TetR family transcriptional regulator [Glaciihabitans tibetensis]